MRPQIMFWSNDLELWPWPSRSTLGAYPCDLWPWPMWPLTFHITSKTVKWGLKLCFLTCWPWPLTLTIKVDLGVIHVHVLTKLHDPRCNGSWDMNFDLVTDIHKEYDAYEPTVHTHRWAQKFKCLPPRQIFYPHDISWLAWPTQEYLHFLVQLRVHVSTFPLCIHDYLLFLETVHETFPMLRPVCSAATQ